MAEAPTMTKVTSRNEGLSAWTEEINDVSELEEGDHIVRTMTEVPKAYQHGLYLGKGYVLQVQGTRANKVESVPIKRLKYDKFEQGRRVYRLSYFSKRFKAQILEEAQDMLNNTKKWRHSYTEHNSEHFVYLLTTGKESSPQVDCGIFKGY